MRQPLDLSEFESEVVLRNLKPDDFQAVADLQLLCFPKMQPWTRDQFDSQLDHFAEGQLGIESKLRDA